MTETIIKSLNDPRVSMVAFPLQCKICGSTTIDHTEAHCEANSFRVRVTTAFSKGSEIETFKHQLLLEIDRLQSEMIFTRESAKKDEWIKKSELVDLINRNSSWK